MAQDTTRDTMGLQNVQENKHWNKPICSYIYEHDVVLPIELLIPSLRIMKQYYLFIEEYSEVMNMELEQLDKSRMEALSRMVVQKKKIVEAYNKRVKKRVFHKDQMMRKVILPLGTKDKEMGKSSPN